MIAKSGEGPTPRMGGLLARIQREHAPFHFPPATRTEISQAERDLGFRLPTPLRLLYTRVANGGIGPGLGVLGVVSGHKGEDGTIEQTYRSLSTWRDPAGVIPARDPAWALAQQRWPAHMLPFCNFGGGHGWYVDIRDESVWFAGPLFVEEGVTYQSWFQPEATSLAEWAAEWLDGIELPHAFRQ